MRSHLKAHCSKLTAQNPFLIFPTLFLGGQIDRRIDQEPAAFAIQANVANCPDFCVADTRFKVIVVKEVCELKHHIGLETGLNYLAAGKEV